MTQKTTKLVDDFTFEESGYQRGNEYWKAETLYNYVKKKNIRPFKLPLAGLDLSRAYKPFDNYNLYAIIYQIKRVNNCNIEIPIILDNIGQIADGLHRVVKAISMDREYIMAYRLLDMPEPDEVTEGENK
jgi:hypothetical protein